MSDYNQPRLDRELRHKLRRASGLSFAEKGYLAFVSSYSKGCRLTQKEIAKMAGCDVRTVQRLQKSLEKKGLIEVYYRAYKKTTIKIAPAEKQMEYVENHPTDPTPVSYHDTTNYHSDTTPVSGYDDTSVVTNIENHIERNIESSKNKKRKERDDYKMSKKEIKDLVDSVFKKQKSMN